MDSLSDLTVDQYLWTVASDAPSPGGGAVAALVVAQAAGLAGMAGRFSVGRRGADPAELSELSELIRAADRLRDTAAPLADADGAAYREYLRAKRMPRDVEPEARAEAIVRATSAAVDVPLRIAEAAAEVARIAAVLLEYGNRNLRGDAAAALLLATAAATTAAILVTDNLAGQPDDPRRIRAVELAAAARAHENAVHRQFPSVADAHTSID